MTPGVRNVVLIELALLAAVGGLVLSGPHPTEWLIPLLVATAVAQALVVWAFVRALRSIDR